MSMFLFLVKYLHSNDHLFFHLCMVSMFIFLVKHSSFEWSSLFCKCVQFQVLKYNVWFGCLGFQIFFHIQSRNYCVCLFNAQCQVFWRRSSTVRIDHFSVFSENFVLLCWCRACFSGLGPSCSLIHSIPEDPIPRRMNGRTPVSIRSIKIHYYEEWQDPVQLIITIFPEEVCALALMRNFLFRTFATGRLFKSFFEDQGPRN